MKDSLIHPVRTLVHQSIIDPGANPGSIEVEPGATVEWTSNSRIYFQFEIRFVGPRPVDLADNLFGTPTKPVVVRAPDEEGEYSYEVHQTSKDGTCKTTGPFLFSVHSCPGC